MTTPAKLVQPETCPKLSIVIVSYNTKDILRACLASLARTGHGDLVGTLVIVVDNGSTDGSVQMVRQDFPDVTLISLGRNLGFAAASNVGIRHSTADYVLLLNSDTEVVGNALATLVKNMEAHPDVAVAGCKLLNSDGSLQPSVRYFPTPMQLVAGRLGLRSIIHRLNPSWPWQDLRTDMDYSQAQEIDVVSGACFLIRRSWLDRVGLLDERFFMYAEETDFCKRVKLHGGKVMYFADAEVIHHRGQSAKQRGDWSYLQRLKSADLYLRMHHGELTAMGVRLATALSLIGLTICYAIRGVFNPPHRNRAVVRVKGLLLTLLGYPTWLRIE